MGLLDGKVAVISGAARGQGRSHAVRLAEEGADVIALDISENVTSVGYPMATEDDLARTVSLVSDLDRRIVASETDVRDPDAVALAVDRGVAELGRLDIVVANAGITSYAPAHELSYDAWRDMIDINLTGVWNLCSASLPHIGKAGKGGAIVLISSSAAHVGVANLAHYSAAKAGVVGLMQSLAVELGPQLIRVNTIHPTGVNSPMLQNEATYSLMSGGRLTTVDVENTPEEVTGPLRGLNVLPIPWVECSDISNAVVYLVSDLGRYVTGTQLRVDAGAAVK